MTHAWSGRPCLVTGGTGFGGSHLAASLLERGALVYALDRVFPRNGYLVRQGLETRVQFIQGDIRDLDLLRPQYRALAAYGHMGREDLGVKWEECGRVEELKKAVSAAGK